MAEIRMPQLGETVTEGTIVRWLKAVGDAVGDDETLFEVSTDKVDTEVPSSAEGFLTAILVAEGETVPIGTVVAVIGATAEIEAPAAESTVEPKVEPTAEASATEQPSNGSSKKSKKAAKSEAIAAGGRPVQPATHVAIGRIDHTGVHIVDDDSDRSRYLSPVVSRMLLEYGLDPATIEGTGKGGRITKEDVLRVAHSGVDHAAPPKASSATPVAATPTSPTPTPTSAITAHPVTRFDDDIVIPHNRARRMTAEHMVRSLATSAHTLIVVEVDYTNVDAVRTSTKASFKAEEGFSLTYLPFIARAVIDAIQTFPNINASFGEEELYVHRAVNLGIAVDIDNQGLVVPVIRDANAKRLRSLARDVSEIATKARAKKLSADDFAGGTITITNAGGYGTFMTAPVINQPQIAIVSTDGVRMRPVAVSLPGGEWGVAVHPVGNLALSFDHRAIDGAYAAAFLAQVRDVLESKEWVAEL